MVERNSLLGAFFRMSCLPDVELDMQRQEQRLARHPVGEACFSDAYTRARGDMEMQTENVRVMLKSVQTYMVNAVKALLKDPEKVSMREYAHIHTCA